MIINKENKPWASDNASSIATPNARFWFDDDDDDDDNDDNDDDRKILFDTNFE